MLGLFFPLWVKNFSFSLEARRVFNGGLGFLLF
jgi:hypothetical protein